MIRNVVKDVIAGIDPSLDPVMTQLLQKSPADVVNNNQNEAWLPGMAGRSLVGDRNSQLQNHHDQDENINPGNSMVGGIMPPYTVDNGLQRERSYLPRETLKIVEEAEVMGTRSTVVSADMSGVDPQINLFRILAGGDNSNLGVDQHQHHQVRPFYKQQLL
eukprot:Trichotokara_eunicae@DN9068_c0_g1_i1.p1